MARGLGGNWKWSKNNKKKAERKIGNGGRGDSSSTRKERPTETCLKGSQLKKHRKILQFLGWFWLGEVEI